MTSPVTRPGPARPPDRRPALGILLAAAVVIAVVLIAPRIQQVGVGASGTPSSAVGSGASAAAASATASAPVAPSRMPSGSSAPIAAASAGPSGTQPSGNGDCGRISAAACAKAIALARKGHESEVAGATRIVVDDTCPPARHCDRKYRFDAAVVFVTAGGDTTGWYFCEVVGLKDDQPTKAQGWQMYELPAHIVAQLRAPQPSP